MIGWLILAAEWIARIVMIPVVARKRSPSAALAWLSVIFFLPWVGVIAYLLIGETRLGRRRTRRHAEAIARIEAAEHRACLTPHVFRPRIAQENQDLALLTQRLGGIGPLGGNSVELLMDSNEVIDRIVHDIDGAQSHAHLLYYIFRDDETGRHVEQALARAAKRGVACRVLVDAVGSSGMLKTMAPRLRDAGVQVAAALPVNPLRMLAARIDLRNHRKITVVDGRLGYAGSQNIVNPDYGQRRVGPWRDLTARIAGPAALQLQEVFCEDWLFDTGEALKGDSMFPAPHIAGETAVQSAPSGPDTSQGSFQQLLIAVINEAQRHVIMTSPYFVPEESLLVALRLAVLRGVRVELLLPERNNHPVVQAAARGHLDTLLDDRVAIHLHRNGLLHAKTVSVDDAFGLISSANFDSRSFRLNFELSVLVYGPAVTERLRMLQMEYVKESVRLDRQAWSRRPRTARAVESAARLLGPLL